MGVEELKFLVSVLGPIGFVMAHSWYLTHKTIPGLTADFRQALTDQRTDFKSSLATQQAAFNAEMEHERRAHADQLDRLSRTFDLR